MSEQPRRVALIVNRRARRGDEDFARARELLAGAGLEPQSATGIDGAGQLGPAVDAALRSSVDAVIVGGGDGTVASVASRLRYRGLPLGVLPLGTANSFARSLGIPTRLDEAVATIAAGHLVDVDLGRVGGHYFANSAAIGLPAQVADADDLSTLKRRFGRAGYLLGGLPRFLRHRPFRARILADGDLHEYDALEIVIANGRYHGGVLVTLQAHVDSHDLVARVVKGSRPWQLAFAWFRSAIGRPAGREFVELLRVRAARVETHPPQAIAVDGEPLARTPTDVAIAAAAIRLYAPPGAT
jgi:YegS/Rv2252/BmrU family lipid kinase